MSNERNVRTTHPRKTARKQRAYDRFTVNHDKAERNASYKRAKAVEQLSLEKALGIKHTPALLSFLAS